MSDTTDPDLRADCSRCFGLCCVALPLTASADFAFDKPAGEPCRNLGPGNGCTIHERLRDAGMAGCTVYDCFGAGQFVSQVTFGGTSWREGPPERARQMFAVFPVVRGLQELVVHLTEALSLPGTEPVRGRLGAALRRVRHLTGQRPDDLAGLDLDPLRGVVGEVLERASRLARAQACAGSRTRSYRRADLAGARLAGQDLRGADLRGALLVGADLRGADLRSADLLGADMRSADLTAADLTGALFLTQPQLEAARGGPGTRVPSGLRHPARWASPGHV